MLHAMGTVTGAFPDLIVCYISSAGIAIGLILFILLILVLAVLVAFTIYYMWTHHLKMKKKKAFTPFASS